ncbi:MULTISPECIES: heliorhodopsin HeR [unclassified Arthrobacter]|jgi:Heliorhodopsin|uniref:heliorhodopsin HeR n=1 Tax=unclassified Arthrobacter TaxID=235627 RepID=UPI0002D50345|nr:MULTISPECIES: heliorhodopsin HeR [unclassified Arthrobacter]
MTRAARSNSDISPADVSDVSPHSFRRLRRINVVAGSLHLLQAVIFTIILAMLDNQVTFPVTADYLAGPPGFPLPPERVELFAVNVGAGVVVFVALSALFHFAVASPAFFPRYEAGLRVQHNYFRWVEYSLSSSVMIWLIAQTTGITDIAALICLFAVNAAMIGFGALQEKYERPGSGNFLPFILGSLAGIVPWIAILIYFLSIGSTSAAEPPAFVYGIIISLFLFFNIFAINQLLQYRQVGPWRDYLYGERAYIILSLIAKTALAWQVFSGAIIPALTN